MGGVQGCLKERHLFYYKRLFWPGCCPELKPHRLIMATEFLSVYGTLRRQTVKNSQALLRTLRF